MNHYPNHTVSNKIYIYIYVCVCVRERERERERERGRDIKPEHLNSNVSSTNENPLPHFGTNKIARSMVMLNLNKVEFAC